MSANWTLMQAQTLYDHPALYDRLVPPGPCEAFYDALAPAGASVLELGCGTGRLTLPLARRGREVVGLDASAPMLSAARVKAFETGTNVRWVQGDMAHFDLGRRFDLIVVSCNSLGHMTTSQALDGCLTSVRRHLAKGGVFAFDVVNPDAKLLQRPSKERVKRADASSGLRVRESASYDADTRVREARWSVHDRDGSVREVAFRLRQFFPDELPSLLESAGLRLTARHGDFDRNRFGARSRLQVCLAALA
jgi:SAM-dependent methyltransferase